ncbi:jerky protein homolog [Belonocnema kinseyi]|uniref:jerky protein homolog n=1 Tax=Belonocnema kinseyi TaxID=2817044 RepID=UPI00143DA30B|nr:jerky protein homolog [Belonocnema kinseyi]
MAEPKKKIFLTKSEKALVLQEIKNGESRDAILNKYKISKRTLRKIMQCACETGQLSKKSNVFEFKNKKSVQSVENTEIENAELEAALFEWFVQIRDSGQPPISRKMLDDKVRIFNELLKGPANFEASNGWVEGFKKRYGIGMKKYKFFVDPSGAAEFSQILKAEIESGYLKLDNIYNADESGILWRILMACTLALNLKEEEEASARNGCKDRLTALFCADASGNHRIPLLLIGKSEIPTCLINHVPENLKDQRLKKLESLGVIYTHQDSAWMDKSIFLLW